MRRTAGNFRSLTRAAVRLSGVLHYLPEKVITGIVNASLGMPNDNRGPGGGGGDYRPEFYSIGQLQRNTAVGIVFIPPQLIKIITGHDREY